MESQKTSNCQSNLEKNNKDWKLYLPNFRLYCKATVIKRAWYWYKNRHIDQWNRIESSEINQCPYSQLIYNKGGKNILYRKDSPSIHGAGNTGQLHVKNEIRTFSHNIHKKINSKWIKDLNVRSETVKLLKENIGGTLWHKLQQYFFWICLLKQKKQKQK